MTKVAARAWWTAKHGAPLADWEDAFALDEASGRFALADGASASAHAAGWARELVTAFVDDPFDLTDTIAFDRWVQRRCVALAELRSAITVGADDQWYVGAAAARDAFATFVGVEFGPGPDGTPACRWLGVGDACLFHVREGELRHAAPLSSPDEFGMHPALVSSNVAHRHDALEASWRGEVPVEVGDQIWLASDALAAWLLHPSESARRVERLEGIRPAEFDTLVAELRDRNEIEDDDVTTVCCEVTP